MNIQRTIEPSPDGSTDYDTDFLAWTMAQATALRDRDLSLIDWDNLVEEVESLGKSQRKELMSRITIVLVHLLKYEFSLDTAPRRQWRVTLLTQRGDLSDLLETNPSLIREVPQVMAKKYPLARAQALAQLDEFEPDRAAHYAAILPEALPYAADEVLFTGWFPTPPDAP